MRRNFVQNGLQISVRRNMETNQLILNISSDYSQSSHKGRLFVDEKRLADEVERFWKSIKTKKLQKISVYFDEIDWYDSMTNIYNTPRVYIERGLKRARTSYHEHGSIPKDWSFEFNAVFNDTTTSTPILEVVKSALDYYFTPSLQKQLKKELKPVLQKKERGCSVGTDY